MKLTPEADREIQRLATRYRISADATRTLLVAVASGGGSMAQFNHPELGGSGQWMQGGMTMVGDLFNNNLRALVANLCGELSRLVQSIQVFETGSRDTELDLMPPHNWWPHHLGSPGASGGQNDVRYAYFPAQRRLAIERSGRLSVYDTLDHQIGGVQQQQGAGSGTLSFTSQKGTFTVDSLPTADLDQASAASSTAAVPTRAESSPQSSPRGHDAVLATIERLGELHKKGLLSADEFAGKKAELLARL